MIPTDFHRRKNEAARLEATQKLVAERQQRWRDGGVLDDIPREAQVDYDPTVWRGARWWADKPYVRVTVNVLIVLAVGKIAWNVAVAMDAWSMMVWIPVLLFLVQLRLHIGRFGA